MISQIRTSAQCALETLPFAMSASLVKLGHEPGRGLPVKSDKELELDTAQGQNDTTTQHLSSPPHVPESDTQLPKAEDRDETKSEPKVYEVPDDDDDAVSKARGRYDDDLKKHHYDPPKADLPKNE